MNRKGSVMLIFVLALVVILIAAGEIWNYKINHSSTRQSAFTGAAQSMPVAESSTYVNDFANGLPTEHFSILNNAGYQYATTTLYQLAAEDQSSGSNNFCVIGYGSSRDPNDQEAYIYWKQKDEILTWFPDATTSEDKNYLLSDRILNLTQKPLDLKTDVVATEQELNGSTYLVTQNWVNNVLDDCQKFGNQFLVTWP